MLRQPPRSLEYSVLRLLLTLLAVYAYWTLAHQVATFAGISWTHLLQATTWLLIPVLVVAFIWAGSVAQAFSGALEHEPHARPGVATDGQAAYWIVAIAASVGWLSPSYPLRFSVIFLCASLWIAWAWRRRSVRALRAEAEQATPSGSDGWSTIWLGIYLLIVVGLVVFINRSDFDDAEYLQLALQTLRYPDKPLYSFDASLGTLIEQFRFAPYRTTSYESFVALISSLSGLSLVETYYLVLPSLWAVLSVLIAFAFLCWFLPRPWALLAVGVFLLITITWGETHVAYGNRMYVRLFQGKGLLVALTTPLTVLMALLWMQRARAPTWTALLMMQILAVGVSSSGLVVTLFATALGLGAGWLSKPNVHRLKRAVVGGLVLFYPIALGLWLKFASNAAGKVEDIGTYLPIEASLGGSLRQMFVLGVTGVVLTLAAHSMVQRREETPNASSNHHSPLASLGWLLALSFILILNPFLIGYITDATSRNMNWRLAWATPMPLLMAAGLTWLITFAANMQKSRGQLPAWIMTLGAMVGFAVGDLPTLRHSNNQLTWGFWQPKLPAEYADAVALTRQIREQEGLPLPVTVLVEPRVGTWLTVVAPDFRLIMPGHGYLVTLQTILPAQEFADRRKLVTHLSDWIEGNSSLVDLGRRYSVTVVAKKIAGESSENSGRYELHLGRQ